MNSGFQALIVDDDVRLRKLISTYLEQQGFNTFQANDGQEAIEKILSSSYDIVILDINLPGISGLTVCKNLRQSGVSIPIIILTARGEESDRIHGLEIGADDYLAKPFSPRELVARIRAILRRSSVVNEDSLFTGVKLKYRFGDFVLDLTRQALFFGDEVIHLSSGEFALLHLFLLESGKPLTREYLVAKMVSREHQPDQRAIDMLVSRLRKKLDRAGDELSLIRTLRGLGYIFVCNVYAEESN